MRVRLLMLTLLSIAFFILALSCGGGGGSSSTGGISGTGVTSASSGTVQGFGSIFVNDRELETDGAEVEIEGEIPLPCSPSLSDDCGLQEGMVVRVEGSLDDNGTTGTATRIKYEDNLEGPISAFVETTPGLVKTLTIMAQTVIVQNGVTSFDNNDPTFDAFSDLDATDIGVVVEVSGFTNFDGSIQATFIEKKADDLATFLLGDDLEIEGTVAAANFNPPNSFEINGLTVDLATNNVTPRNGTLAVGVLVEVKGDDLLLNTLTATDVEVKVAGLGVDDIDKAEVEGFVTNLGVTTFEVNGQLVNYTTATFVGGTEAELANGIKVEAEGPISGGILQAIKIEFEDSVKFEANALNVNAGAGTLNLEGLSDSVGTLITVRVDNTLTEFKNPLTGLGDISDGDELKIRGRLSGAAGTTVVATEIERVDTNRSDRIIIQGTVDAFQRFVSVTIIGVFLDVTTIPDNEFKDDDAVIGEAAFFDALSAGDLVKARADLDLGTGVVTWNQIEFED